MSRSKDETAVDPYRGADPGGDAAKLLRKLEDESPFEAGGGLSNDTVTLLRTLDPESLGSAATILLRHAVALPAADAQGAAAAIDALLQGGPAGPTPIELDLPALVEIYRDLMADEGRRPISDLIVRLLGSVDRFEIFASVGMDAASLDLRARLTDDLDGPPLEATPADDAPVVRGLRTRGLMSGAPPPEVATGDFEAELPADSPTPVAGRPLAESATTPGSQPPTYRAYGLLESDETVVVARPFELKVGLSPSQQPGVAGPALELPKPEAEEKYTLDIQLFADGFDLAAGESWRHSLTVSKDDLHPWVAVHLTARPLPEPRATRSITATYSINGETLGAAIRQVTVTTDATLPAVQTPVPTSTGTNITAPTGKPPADVTITIKRGLDAGVLQWGLESTVAGVALPSGKPPESDIGEDPQDFATGIIRSIFVQGDQEGIFQLLQGIGATIRDRMPRPVREAIAAAGAAVAPRTLDILLLTEEPYVPWELALVDAPFDPMAPPYLGAQANIGRWVLDEGATPTDPPREVDATTMSVVWGVYNTAGLQRLEAAEEEAQLLQTDYHATSIDARPTPVYQLLAGNPPSDILHFAVHGKYAAQGVGDGLYLVQGPPITSLHIRGSNLKKRGPFVFLNACQVGSAQDILGSYGGIAQAFLQIGASGVVAPLWSVDDKVAKTIALKFYEHALERAESATGDPESTDEAPKVADLLRKARAGLVENAALKSSTYLAYQFYGHPSLRLSWKPAAAAGGTSNG